MILPLHLLSHTELAPLKKKRKGHYIKILKELICPVSKSFSIKLQFNVEKNVAQNKWHLMSNTVAKSKCWNGNEE